MINKMEDSRVEVHTFSGRLVKHLYVYGNSLPILYCTIILPKPCVQPVVSQKFWRMV